MPTATALNPALLPCTVGFLVLVPELILLITRLSRPATAARADRSSLLQLWGTILGSIVLAAPFALFQAPTALQFELGAVGIGFVFALLAAGIVLRWWAIRTLGQFFTVDVAVHREHQLVTAGPYAWIRHPSYTGLLLKLLALALTFQNGLCVALIMVPTTVALLWRIAVEEQALAGVLGDVYRQYLARSYSLVPFVALRRKVAPVVVATANVIPIAPALQARSQRRRLTRGADHRARKPGTVPLPPLPQRDSHVA